MNRENVTQLDGVLYTHSHSDHVNGIDELRAFRFRNKALVPAYGNAETMEDLRHRFPYLFNGGRHELYPPVIEAHELNETHFGKPQILGGIPFIPFEQDHGTCTSLGYRFGDTAYSVDILTLEEEALKTLRGIKTWIVDAAAYRQDTNPLHANLETIYKLNEKIGAEAVYLSSLSLPMDYKTLCNELPPGYYPAYDGLRLTCTF